MMVRDGPARRVMGPTIEVRRVHDDPRGKRGEYRVLVGPALAAGHRQRRLADRCVGEGLAPSTGLRRWYGHDPARFVELSKRYRLELHESGADALAALLTASERKAVLVLLTATKDVGHSGAAVLAGHLRRRITRR